MKCEGNINRIQYYALLWVCSDENNNNNWILSCILDWP